MPPDYDNFKRKFCMFIIYLLFTSQAEVTALIFRCFEVRYGSYIVDLARVFVWPHACRGNIDICTASEYYKLRALSARRPDIR